MAVQSFISFLLLAMLLLSRRSILGAAPSGSWELLLSSIGIPAMHMQLLHTDRVVISDRTYTGGSNISLPENKCLKDKKGKVLYGGCFAHTVEYDVVSNSVRPLLVQTDIWCSSGAVLPDGTLVQMGGFNSGEKTVRLFNASAGDSSDWEEKNRYLTKRRWYATNQILPDGRVIVVGGRGEFNYEFYPKKSVGDKAIDLPFLSQTNVPIDENNLYPLILLNTDGNLFIFANNRAILFNYTTNHVVKTYPEIPGGDPRSYPSTGSGVLLPLKNNSNAEVLICGGAPKGSYQKAKNQIFVPALNTCARILIDDPNPKWELETMPTGRVMGDMVLLSTGDVLIVNGACNGSAGWENGRNPALSPVLYQPNKPAGSRFEMQQATTIPRMYHSTAILLRDGRVIVAGGNPHRDDVFSSVPYPTELSIEAFSPEYMKSTHRPAITSPEPRAEIRYDSGVSVRFTAPALWVEQGKVRVTLVSPAFSSHSIAMNQRAVEMTGANAGLKCLMWWCKMEVRTPASRNVAPPGYYMMFVVYDDVPSEGIWVHIS